MPDSYAAILGDVLAIYETRPRPLGLKASHFRITHLAHGWYMRAHRTAEAIMRLRDLGYAHEAWPLRRAVLEHTVNLKWLATDGERVADLVRRAGGHSAKKRRASVVEAGWSSADLAIFDEVIADLDATDEHRQLDYLQAFAQRVKAYGTAADYAGYLIDTAHSHPSWETAAPYLRDDGEGAVALLNAPPASPDPDDAGQCAIHLWQGLVAINSMMETQVWSDSAQSSGGPHPGGPGGGIGRRFCRRLSAQAHERRAEGVIRVVLGRVDPPRSGVVTATGADVRYLTKTTTSLRLWRTMKCS